MVFGSPNAAVDVYVNNFGVNGGLLLGAGLCCVLFFAVVSSITVTSRIAYAMARDGALPLSNVWSGQHQSIISHARALSLHLCSQVCLSGPRHPSSPSYWCFSLMRVSSVCLYLILLLLMPSRESLR